MADSIRARGEDAPSCVTALWKTVPDQGRISLSLQADLTEGQI